MSTVTNNPTNDSTKPPEKADKPTGPVPLTDLPAGAMGLIMRIEEDDHAMLIRLKTMGMHEGRRVRVIRTGSRIIVSCGGTRIGLAAEVAQHIRVAPTPQ
jgi:Fe2+ transport system protein FeoA